MGAPRGGPGASWPINAGFRTGQSTGFELSDSKIKSMITTIKHSHVDPLLARPWKADPDEDAHELVNGPTFLILNSGLLSRV